MMVEGECNCGAVSFELATKLSDVYICHCSICRRSTGGQGVAVSIARKDKFSWVKGKTNISKWTKPAHEWQTSFCSTCGSQLPGENDDDHMYIPVSLLTTETNTLKVAHHLFVGSKAHWEEIGDIGRQHLDNYRD